MFLNWLSGVLVGVGGSDLVGQAPTRGIRRRSGDMPGKTAGCEAGNLSGDQRRGEVLLKGGRRPEKGGSSELESNRFLNVEGGFL